LPDTQRNMLSTKCQVTYVPPCTKSNTLSRTLCIAQNFQHLLTQRCSSTSQTHKQTLK